MDDEGQLPVFTSTSEVEFALDERSPRQVVTLYNPYGYAINYKVLCTAPSNYSVAEANGTLLSKCCKDLVIRCKTRLSVGYVDRLRVEIRKKGSNEVQGSRDLTLRTVAERSSRAQADPARPPFYGMSDSMGGSSAAAAVAAGNAPGRRHPSGHVHQQDTSQQWVYVVAFIACSVALLLPTSTDPTARDSSVPVHLHLSLSQKLVAAYILGVMSMLLLRPT